MSHVDSPSPVTHVSLCAGYGGIDLGLRRAIRNLRTIAVSEIEAFACANLVAKMEAGLLDPAPIWTDLKTFPWSDFRDRVDILSGGYPCQPFSAAGKRLGAEDPRHLWPFISAGIAAMRPAVCFFENVEGHISLGLPDVIEDLGRLGYRATWCVASASECGAPHQRKRIWILAHRHGVRLQQYASEPDRRHWEDLQEQPQGGCASELALTSSIGSAAGFPRPQQGHEGIAGVADHCGDQAWPSRPGEQQHAWEPPRVVVDAKSQRAGQRSELRSEECGSGSALSWDVEQSGEGDLVNAKDCGRAQSGSDELQAGIDAASRDSSGKRGAVANDHRPHAGHGEQRPERTPRDLSGGCGEGLHDAARLRSPEPADGRGQAASWADASSDEAMGNSTHANRRPRVSAEEAGAGPDNIWRRRSGESSKRTAFASLGRDIDGALSWSRLSELSGLSDQELAEIRHWMVASDNRTDELRLLGNGVVPACAERAFRLLVGELMEHQP